MTSPQDSFFPSAPQDAPKRPAPRHQPNIALETFRFGHIVALFVLGVLLAQLGPLAAQESDALQQGMDVNGKFITFVVLLALLLPFAIYSTAYLRRGAVQDRILSSVLLLMTTVISIVAAVYVVPAFYSVTAIFLFVVLALEWFGPLAVYWRGEAVDFSEMKSAMGAMKAKRAARRQRQSPYGAPYGQPGSGAPYGAPYGQPGSVAPYGAPYGQPGPGAPFGQPGQPGQPGGAPFGAPYSQPMPPVAGGPMGAPYGRPSGAEAAGPQGPQWQYGQGRPAPTPHETAPFAQPGTAEKREGDESHEAKPE